MADALMTARELTALYRNGRLSPVEATQAALDRIAAYNPRVNAFCFLDEAAALAAARASEARWRAGKPLGPVDGVPATVKDLSDVRGWPTRYGCRLFAEAAAATEDAPAVARLRGAGAVLLGKTTTPEFGWKGVTDSPLCGVTRNPWDLARTPGGSSGGAAVAAALGLGTLHLGSDGGGSIRIPASFTGVYGLKPSFGRVAQAPPSPFAALSQTGPITRRVEDAALMLSVIAGPDPRDAAAWPLPVGPAGGSDFMRSLDQDVGGFQDVEGLQGVGELRFGFAATMDGLPVAPGVAAAVAEGAALLAELGGTVEPVSLDLPEQRDVVTVLWLAGMAALVDRFPAPLRDGLDPGLLAYAEAGRRLTAPAYASAMRDRELVAGRINALFQRFDLVLLPTLPIAAFEAGRDTPGDGPYADSPGWTPFAYPFNLSRHPAASLPCGFDGGMPVGLQIVGPLGREDLVLRTSRALEAVLPIQAPPLS